MLNPHCLLCLVVLKISIENDKVWCKKKYFVTSAARSLYAREGSAHRPFCSPGGYIDWCCPCVQGTLTFFGCISLASSLLETILGLKRDLAWMGSWSHATEFFPFFIMGRVYQEYNFQGVWTNFEHSVTTHGFAFLLQRCPAEFLLPDATWGPQLPVIPLIHSP